MEVSVFIGGLARDLDQRCKNLSLQIRAHDTHPDVTVLTQAALAELQDVRKETGTKRALVNAGRPDLWRFALSDLRSLDRRVYLVESVVLPAVLHYGQRDHRHRRIVEKLAAEVGYPAGFFPTVVTTSERYYWTHAGYKIIGVPAGDLDGGMLGWPDLTHEMAHILLAAWTAFLKDFIPMVNRHYKTRREVLTDLGMTPTTSQLLAKSLAIAQNLWSHSESGTWRVELAADLIATYWLGPAYAWQHVRLTTSRGNPPFFPGPGEVAIHPSDQARLDGMLAMLRRLGQDGVAQEIDKQWQATVKLRWGTPKPAGYDDYYPPTLIAGLADTVLAGCRANSLVSFEAHRSDVNPGVVTLMNRAWQSFNRDPSGYPNWESQALSRLYECLGVADAVAA